MAQFVLTVNFHASSCGVPPRRLSSEKNNVDGFSLHSFPQDLRATRGGILGRIQREMVAAVGTLRFEQPHQRADGWKVLEASQFCRGLLYFGNRPAPGLFGGSPGVVVEQQPVSSRNTKRGP